MSRPADRIVVEVCAVCGQPRLDCACPREGRFHWAIFERVYNGPPREVIKNDRMD